MNERTKKIFWAIRLICSGGAILFALLQILGVWNKANFVAIPLLSACLVFQSVQERKNHKGVAILSIIAAVFILVCTVCIMTL